VRFGDLVRMMVDADVEALRSDRCRGSLAVPLTSPSEGPCAFDVRGHTKPEWDLVASEPANP
jgi:hypothetical protein